MSEKVVLITGATDGIGLATAKKFKSLGHKLIVHGRSAEKLENVAKELGADSVRADLSNLDDVKAMADTLLSKYEKIDILINNAGVFKTPNPRTKDGYDLRYMVNTFAPFLLTKKLLPLLKVGRVINLSSAAQASIDFEAMLGKVEMTDFEAYAQSKLAITMWSSHMAQELGSDGPVIIAVNPASLLGTKMVKEGFNTAGNDINIGVDILTRLSLDEEHVDHSGEYYDNDRKSYASPQADGQDRAKAKRIVELIEEIVSK